MGKPRHVLSTGTRVVPVTPSGSLGSSSFTLGYVGVSPLGCGGVSPLGWRLPDDLGSVRFHHTGLS